MAYDREGHKEACSFCGKSYDSVPKLIQGGHNTFICAECVECYEAGRPTNLGFVHRGETWRAAGRRKRRARAGGRG